MTQEQLADAARSDLCPRQPHPDARSRRKAISAANRRCIEIDDWQTLAKVADFQPRYLHFRNGARLPSLPSVLADRETSAG